MKDKLLQNILIYLLLIVLCFVLLAVTGCKAPKKVTQSEHLKTETEGHFDFEKAKKDSATARYVTEMLRTTNGQVEVNIKETRYDTGKPIVPETGKPPVASEKQTKIKAKKETTEQGKTAIEENSGSDTNIKGSVEMKGKGEVDTVVKSDVAKDPYRYRYMFGILVVLVVYLSRNRIVNGIKKMFMF